MTSKKTKRLTLSALFLALGLILPFFTMQIPEIGSALLPMHIPVLICGFVCGAPYGLAVGFIVPLLRCLLWGMPPFMTALAMAFELAAYGALTGLFYSLFHGKKLQVYLALIASMTGGRVVWGVVSFVIYRVLGNPFTWEIFVAGALLNAIPGIVLQLVIIPPIVLVLEKQQLLLNQGKPETV